MRTILVILSLLIFPLMGHSQGKWTYFTKKNGLISDNIYKSFADKRGNIWFIAHKGISRYDGDKWHNYDIPSHHEKFHVFEDSNGNIWLWMEENNWSLTMFDGNDFKTFTNGELECKYVSDIAEDNNGNIWVGGRGDSKGQIDVYDGEKWANYTRKNAGIARGLVTNIFTDSKGNIWINSQRETIGDPTSLIKQLGGSYISRYDGETWWAYDNEGDLPFVFKSGLYNARIIEDKRGNVWFGGGFGDVGLLKYHDNKWMSYSNEVEGSIIRMENISMDTLWVYTGKGTYIFDYNSWRLAWNISKPDAFLKDKSGLIWIGMNSGIGRCSGNKWKFFTFRDGFSDIKHILQDSKGNIWFGGDNLHLYQNSEWVKTNGQPIINPKISDVTGIVEDKSGNIWVSMEKGVYEYSE